MDGEDIDDENYEDDAGLSSSSRSSRRRKEAHSPTQVTSAQQSDDETKRVISDADSEHDTEEEFKQKQMRKDPDMDTFLKRMFLDEEAAHYAEVLRALGITEPKDLAGISQERLVQAGVRKFHARKIGSAEIYRAFL